MKNQNSSIEWCKTKLRPLIFALNTVLLGTAIAQVPLIAQTAQAALAEKPAGAGVAIIAMTTATAADASDLSKAAAALKSKGYEVKFALPSDSLSANALKQIASSGGYQTVSGSAQQIMSGLPNAVAYGDKAAVSLAALSKGQKSDSNGAYDINGKLVATSGASSFAVAANTTASVNALQGSVEAPLKSPVEEAVSAADLTLEQQLQLAGFDPMLPVMPFPAPFERSAGRYGEWRSCTSKSPKSCRDNGGRYHAGWDLSSIGRKRVPLTWMGVPASVTSDASSGAKGNSVNVIRPNGDSYYYFHMDQPVNRCIGRANWPTQPGGPGFCGRVGNTGAGISHVHLHLGYGVSQREQDKRRRQAWLPSSASARSTYSGGTSMKNIRPHADGVSAYQSDITPYLSHDMPIKKDHNNKWLGSTMRQQFNALYGTKLPTGADDESNLAPGAQFSSTAPKMLSSQMAPVSLTPRWGKYEWTPDQIAAARAGTIKGMYSGSYPEGLYMASPGMVASFLLDSDGEGFGSLPRLAESPDITKQSAREIIQNIGTLRYGNDAWHQALLKLSSKALMSEYAAMTAAENYIEQQNSLVSQRVEVLMAGLIRSRSAPLQGRIEAIETLATADVVPNMINTKVEQMQYAYGGAGGSASIDLSNLPNGMKELVSLLFQTIAGAESNGDYGAYNTGTSGNKKNMRSCYSTSPGCQKLITKTVGQILASHSLSNSNLGRMFAVGKYQLIDVALTEALSKGAFPNGSSTVFTPEVQESLIYNFFLKSKRPDLGKFVQGDLNISLRTAQLNIAREWASIGTPSGEPIHKNKMISDGYTSYYQEPGVNAASAKKTNAIIAILTKMDEVRRGGGSSEPAAPTETPTP